MTDIATTSEVGILDQTTVPQLINKNILVRCEQESPDVYLPYIVLLEANQSATTESTIDFPSTFGAIGLKTGDRYRVNAGDISRILKEMYVRHDMGGGEGLIIFGHDDKFDRPIAIKTLRKFSTKKADATFVRGEYKDRTTQFVLNMQRVAKLEHPNIMRIYDISVIPINSETYQAFTIMEKYEDDTLHEVLGGNFFQEHFSAEERTKWALNFITQLCNVVDFSHEKGMVIGDLKPSNIICDGLRKKHEAHPKLIDLAGMQTSDEKEQQEVYITTMYAPPEYSSSQPVTTSFDLYSLALIAEEICSAILSREQNKNLEPVFDNALHNNPEKRLKSASELLKKIQSVLS